MQLQPVHEMTKDRVSGIAKMTRINPTRQFCLGSKSGVTWFTWQNGTWFDLAGHELDEATIPEDLRKSIADTPVIAETDGPDVTKVCRLCKERMNSSQLEDHMYAHVETLMKGSAADAKAEAVPPPVSVKK